MIEIFKDSWMKPVARCNQGRKAGLRKVSGDFPENRENSMTSVKNQFSVY